MAFLKLLSKTRLSFLQKMKNALLLKPEVDEEVLEQIEEVLISSDISLSVSLGLMDRLRSRVRDERFKKTDQVLGVLRDELKGLLKPSTEKKVEAAPDILTVFLVAGVNGVGKTTTIGKLAHWHKGRGKKVLLAAGDTFRAAAIEQIAIWAERVGVDLIKQAPGADPAAVAFDAVRSAAAQDCQVLLVDTAGRLHTKLNLMAELKKIRLALQKEKIPLVIHTLLVLDGTSGQNALVQAQAFNEVAALSGLIVTKLDGTAKGGGWVFRFAKR